MEKLELKTKNIFVENIAKIEEIFPNCIVEIKSTNGSIIKSIDFDQLRQELSSTLIEGPHERYQLNWPGKRESILLANTPTTKTLRPSQNESVMFSDTKNLFLEGDNLDALKLIQETYLGRVKLIYIDPPYNTGNDFIYTDDYAENTKDYLIKSSQTDSSDYKLVTNVEANGRFHSNWLSMIYSRLKVAKNLLKDDGLIFMSIDDNEVHNLRKICDELFGEQCFVKHIHVQMSATQGMKVKAAKSGNIVKNGEHILVYSKDGHKDIGLIPLLDPAKYDNHYSLFLEKIGDELYKETSLFEQVRKDANIIEELLSFKLIDSKSTSLNIQNCYQFSPLFKKWVDINAEHIVRTHDTVELPDDFSSQFKDDLVRVYKSVDRSYLVAKASNGNFYQKIQLSEKIAFADDFNSTYGPTTIRGDWWADFYLDMGNVNKEGDIEFKNGKKPVRLIKQIVKFTTKDDDLILDFFAGSSTTAHAVMLANSEDGHNRKFIMVQVPEACDPKSESYKEGFLSIADISKERIRRSGNQILHKHADSLKNRDLPLDIGFRVLKVDSSNMEDVYYNPDEITQDLLGSSIDNIKEDRAPEDLLFQVLLDWGVDLSLPIAHKFLMGRNVYLVDENALVACFDRNIDEEFVKELAAVKPLRAVFLDAGFSSDSLKINVEQIFKQISPLTDIKTI